MPYPQHGCWACNRCEQLRLDGINRTRVRRTFRLGGQAACPAGQSDSRHIWSNMPEENISEMQKCPWSSPMTSP